MTPRIFQTAGFFLSTALLLSAQAPADRAWGILSAGTADTNVEKRTKAVRALGLIVHDAKAQNMAEKA
jgi:hypothetical protein